jgi:hypothetical protein
MPPKKSSKTSAVPTKDSLVKSQPVVKRFTPEAAPPLKRHGKGYLIVLLIIAMGLSAAYLLIKGMSVTNQSVKQGGAEVRNGEQAEESQKPENVIDKVKRHILVNEDEAPYVATISNIDLVRAKNPEFYRDASQGDKVLIWSDKAVIYSEKLDKLVAVTSSLPASPDEEEGDGGDMEDAADESMEELEEITVEIRNGSRVAGEASRLRASLTDRGIEVERIGDAAGLYEGTRIIDLTGGRANSVVDAIMEEVGGIASQDIPEGEPDTEANILIIIGR